MFKNLADNVSSFFSSEKAEESRHTDRAKKVTATPPPSPAEGPVAASVSTESSKSAPFPETLASQLTAAKTSENPSTSDVSSAQEASEGSSTESSAPVPDPVPASETKAEESKEEKDRSGEVLEEAAEKAYAAAKEWGSYLWNATKVASKSVTETAKTLKKSVEDKTIIGDFTKEQDKFVQEKKQKDLRSDAAVPPWVGYNEEDSMKEQILSLSSDKRNFLRNPPAGVQFEFNFETTYPVAMATLKEDPRLKEMRFEVVPKKVTEHDFWRNYFYRVSLIKQSTQLSLLAQQSAPEQGAKQSSSADVKVTPQSPAAVPSTNEEFASDDYNGDVNDEELQREMESLRVTDKGADKESKRDSTDGDPSVAEWERELQDELNEFEVVGADGDADIDDDELEREILEEIDTARP